jgi:putative pyruvate formate lyase activating enzyme
VDREKEKGFCGVVGYAAARVMLHFGEEPCIIGRGGTGAIFFSGCSLGCVFCQNHEISKGNIGKTVDGLQLRAVMDRLISEGASSISLITPTPHVPVILKALETKPCVPIVYNTGGFENLETIRALSGKVDVYLPDLKTLNPAAAETLLRARAYPQIAQAAILEMVNQVGNPVLDEDGLLRRGVLLRHLILPGHVGDSLRVIDWVRDHLAGRVFFSLMAQYTPMPGMAGPLDRLITRREYDIVQKRVIDSGLDGFVQSRSAAGTKEIPSFTLEGL